MMTWYFLFFLVSLGYGDYVRTFGSMKENYISVDTYEKRREIPQRYSKRQPEQGENMPPLWMLQQLDNVDDAERFLLDYVEDGRNFTTESVLIVDPLAVYSEDGENDGQARKAGVQRVEMNSGPPFAEAAGCNPVPTVVPLYDTLNPRIIVYPKCSIVEQCQGCCNLPAHGCQPTRTENKDVRVIKAMYQGNGQRLTYLGKFTVRLEKHLACGCSCKVKAEDCHQWHTHNPYTCKCECNDKRARDACMALNYKTWEENSCMCMCKESRICSSGLYFDHDLCRCNPMTTLEEFHADTNNEYRRASLSNNDTLSNVTTTSSSSTSSTTTTTTTSTTTTTEKPRRRDFWHKLKLLKDRTAKRKKRIYEE